MAGHSHWAGIKHKKGRQDKLRSKIFSKISREITVAAKLGSKDPDTNHRLRAAIEIAKDANMPKENINRAISKSENSKDVNFYNLRYEGFGPNNIALIIETLTDNKNRTAANVRKNLQKFGGRLASDGSTAHFFDNCGVIQFSKKLKPSKRGEIEIIDLINIYKRNKNLKAEFIGRGGSWLDTGNISDFYNATNFVSAIENRQGLKIACLEEIAFQQKWIGKKEIKKSILFYGNCDYSKYLKSLIN